MRARRGLVLAVLLLLAGASAALAQGGPTLELDPDVASAGQTVTARGRSFPSAATSVDLRLDAPNGSTLATGIRPSSSGSFDATFTVQGQTTTGPHDVLACYQAREGYTCAARDRLTVQAAPPTTRATSTTSPRVATPTTTPTTRPAAGLATTTTTQAGALVGGSTTTTGPVGPGQVAGATTSTGLGVGGLSGGELPDLFVTDMEVSQSIQNLDNDMPLVGGRTTIVRVFLQTEGGSLANVYGAMQADPAGGPPVFVPADNGPLTVTEAGSDRLDIATTLQFTLPPQAVATGQTELAVFVYSGAPSSLEEEPNEANNWSQVSVEFEAVPTLAVRLFPVHTHETADQASADDTLGTNGLSDLFTVGGIFPAAYRYHPVAELVTLPGQTVAPMAHHADNPEFPLVMQHWDPAITGHMGAFNAAIMDLWEQSTPATEYEQFYGVFRAKPSEWGGLSNYTVANGKVSLDTDAASPWYQTTGGKTMIHEISHNIGFLHSLCSGDEPEGGAVEPYPFTGPPCVIAENAADGWFGLDVAWEMYTQFTAPSVISNSPSVAAPFRGYPVMGYANPRWADPYFYCRALEFYGINCSALPIPENQGEPIPDTGTLGVEPKPVGDAATDGHVRIAALAHRDTGTVELLDTRRVAQPMPHALAEHRRRRAVDTAYFDESFTLELFRVGSATASPEVLLSVPLHSLDSPDHPAGPASRPQVVVLSELVPYPAGTTGLRVVHDGRVVAQRDVSASVPEIEVTGVSVDDGRPTVSWTARDGDGDALRFNISYSPDGGTTWVALVLGRSESSYTHPDALPGGERAILRVEASDGVHTAAHVSEPFAMPDQAPVLSILSPAEGARLPTHNVVLQASAWDLEDGERRRPTVRWRSDRDGALGEGRWVLARLTTGHHVVTAEAVDSAGNEQVATVEFDVVAEGDDDALLTQLERILAQGPPDGGGFPWMLWLPVGIVVAAVAAGATYVRRRRARA